MQNAGATFIAASQRPDGTWRKPRRVKDGYVPPEEVPLYESKGKQFAKSKPQYPVGLSPEVINASKARKEKALNSPIPGLILDTTPEAKSSKKKKKKKSSPSTADELSESMAKAQITSKEPESQNTPIDPAKRLKNLRKRLREIEAIEQKVSSGQLKSLEKEQLEKIERKSEYLQEVETLSELVEGN